MVVRNMEMMMQKSGSEMKQVKLSIEERNFFEKLCSLEYLTEDFKMGKGYLRSRIRTRTYGCMSR